MNPGVPREKLSHLSQITGNLKCLKLCGIIIPSHIGTYLIGTQRLIYRLVFNANYSKMLIQQ